MFLWRVDYALKEKGFDLANVIFAPFLYGEVVPRILIFCGFLLCMVGMISDAGAFSLTSFEM